MVTCGLFERASLPFSQLQIDFLQSNQMKLTVFQRINSKPICARRVLRNDDEIRHNCAILNVTLFSSLLLPVLAEI
jgi:hypothetical protein